MARNNTKAKPLVVVVTDRVGLLSQGVPVLVQRPDLVQEHVVRTSLQLQPPLPAAATGKEVESSPQPRARKPRTHTAAANPRAPGLALPD